jgi:hypothetical protein
MDNKTRKINKIQIKIPCTIVKFVTTRNFFIKNDNNIMYHAYLDNFDIDGIGVKDVDDVGAIALAHCTSCLDEK